ncbi:MAG: ATP-binding protein [Acidobacteria bacterium]|nr:ATP-binding protein [Acidobacteriota bacterium]
MDFEKLGLFYLGRRVDPDTRTPTDVPLLYDAADLVTHAVILGMTGSGKTGLGIGLIEEAAIDGVPVLAIDPKGDLSNLLLTFPQLQPAEFAPWVNPHEARLQELSLPAFAEREATRWREGLAESGQGSDRIQRLRASADFAVYTPGSHAARPLSILRTFEAPAAAISADLELLTERASAAATSLLTLAGVEAEALRSREHILLSTLLTEAWRQQRSLDLPRLIAQVQSPPIQRVGVLELDSFYPAADRFKLASDLNRLLAAPDFAVWLEGEPLDINALLYTAQGKPRVSVLSIAHLDDRERMFFVSLVLNELVSWMRLQSGTSSLRAMVYIDEMTGFLPPVAVPPSKPPLLTLLKQARAFGLGMTLATQNPVDLDYKALGNAGTWFLGRLQTERDKARLLDGLEGANSASGAGFNRQTTDRLLSSLEKRTFLLHNVHEQEPVLFKTRWTMSYLRGPLGREELSRLSALTAPAAPPPFVPRAEDVSPAPPAAATAPGVASVSTRADVRQFPEIGAASTMPGNATVASGSTQGVSGRPVLDPAVPQFFGPGDGGRWMPALIGAARVAYSDAKLAIAESREVVVITPIVDGPVPVDWEHAEPADFTTAHLVPAPQHDAAFAALPPAAANPKKYATWTKDFTQWVGQSQTVELLRSASTKLVSMADESERDFRIRLQTTQREQRDVEMTRLREKYAAKIAVLDDRVRRSEAAVQREQQQASESKMQTGVSMAATIFGAMLGRKAVSATTLGRATTAARGMGRIGKEAQDVERARTEVLAVTARRDDLSRALETELQAIADRWDARDEPLERVLVKPKRGGVTVQLVALVWLPRP